MTEAQDLGDLRSLDSRRVRARLIDAAVFLAAYIVLRILIGPFELWQGFAFLWAAVTYFFVFEATSGQTIGKRHYAIQVMSLDGSPPSLNAVATRNVIRIVEEPLIALIVMAGTRKRRQRVGDLFATTTVARAGFSPMRTFTPRLVIYPAIWAASAAVVAIGIGPDWRSQSGAPSTTLHPSAPLTATADPVDPITFAEAITKTCVYNVDRGVSAQNQIKQEGKSEGISKAGIQAQLHYSWARFESSTYTLTGSHPAPTENAALFARWRATVQKRADLYRQIGDAWTSGSGASTADLSHRIVALRARTDELGQRLGFSPCVPSLPGIPIA